MTNVKSSEQLAKPARLDLKTNQIFKTQLEEAAVLSGVNLTAFILNAAAEKAREVMSFHANTVLANTAWSRLTDILENPPKEVTPTMQALYSKEYLPNGGTI